MSLKFQFGETGILSKHFEGVVLNVHFRSLPVRDEAALDALAPVLPPGCDVALVRSQPVTSEVSCLIERSGYLRYVPRQYKRFFVDLERSTFDEYLAAFSPKSRSTLRRKVRKLAEALDGRMSVREFSTPAEIDAFYELARRVSARTYQERLLDKGLPADQYFRRRVCELAALDRVRGYLLSDAEKPVAYIFCPIEDGTLLYDYVGYDPDYKALSPGTVLQYLVIEKLFEERRHRAFDFTEGEGQHKEFFATDAALCADVYFFRPTALHRCLLHGHAGLARASGSIVRLLRALGIDKKVKGWIRSR